MDTQHPSAPPRAQSHVAVKNHPNRRPHSAPAGGLVHDNARHTTHFTVIGNHLAQHPDLSLLAIGLAVHLQSLRAGARVDIKTLAARFKEGATRIAAALRELESHGPAPKKRRPRSPGAKPLPAVPRPTHTSPTLLQTATDLLANLRRHDPRLLLSACDTAHLAPGVAAWLERDVTPTAVRHALTANLPPEGLHRPAALLAHRLTTQLPPPPPFRAPAPPVKHPLQNCDGCDRAFRSPTPGLCRDCRPPLAAAA
ncbi:helix-turn-helix domain-containing protein [Streptomyces sp. NPDC018693]|uniref:helix-turn-helix domain-containing protein n=1 Tax=unclassified Streptomyces TaxID=2593676 RepID=UPI0037AF45C7